MNKPKTSYTVFVVGIVAVLFLIGYGIRYSHYDYISVQSVINSHSLQKDRVVVSLTTFLGRLQGLNSTLQSMTSQSFQPDRIIVHIPKIAYRVKISETLALQQQEYISILKQQFGDKVLFNFIDRDFGPSTKLLGTLLLPEYQHQDTIIITVDDDFIYHPHLVKYLYFYSLKYPNSVIATRCEELVNSRDAGAVNSTRKYSWKGVRKHESECKGWFMGYKGVLYRYKFFEDHSVFNTSLVPASCRLHDDVFLSGTVRANGIKIMMIDPPFNPALVSLAHEYAIFNVVDKNQQQEECIDHFNHFDFNV